MATVPDLAQPLVAATDLPMTNPLAAVVPARMAVNVTPSDTEPLRDIEGNATVSRSVFVNEAGNIAFENESGGLSTVAVAVGFVPIRASKILASGTTATGIVAYI
jgi:hypothetical protein